MFYILKMHFVLFFLMIKHLQYMLVSIVTFICISYKDVETKVKCFECKLITKELMKSCLSSLHMLHANVADTCLLYLLFLQIFVTLLTHFKHIFALTMQQMLY